MRVKVTGVIVDGGVISRRSQRVQVCHLVQERDAADREVLELVAGLAPRVVTAARVDLVLLGVGAQLGGGIGKVLGADLDLAGGAIVFRLSIRDSEALGGSAYRGYQSADFAVHIGRAM